MIADIRMTGSWTDECSQASEARVEEGSETLLRCTLAAGVEDTAMA